MVTSEQTAGTIRQTLRRSAIRIDRLVLRLLLLKDKHNRNHVRNA